MLQLLPPFPVIVKGPRDVMSGDDDVDSFESDFFDDDFDVLRPVDCGVKSHLVSFCLIRPKKKNTYIQS